MDRVTRYGLCVPATTIGIAPICGPETSGRRIRRLTCKSGRHRRWGALRADVGRHSPHDLVCEHQDAPSALSSQGRHGPAQNELDRHGESLRIGGARAFKLNDCLIDFEGLQWNVACFATGAVWPTDKSSLSANCSQLRSQKDRP